MFAGDSDAATKAEAASKWFANFKFFKSHGRRVSRDDARKLDLKVVDLEKDSTFQDLVLSVHHATRITFSNTPMTKIVENHNGRAYIEQLQQIQVVAGPQPPGQQPPPLQIPQPPQAPAGNRAQRRQQQRRGR